MTLETVKEMPVIEGRTSLKYREMIEAVKTAEGGKILKWTNDVDETRVNASTVRILLEKQTKKMVVVKRADHKTLYVKVLSNNEIQKEKEERKKRSEEMKKKLKGKK